MGLAQWIGSNSELLFRIGLFCFLFGVIIMLLDKDFEKRFENNSFVRKAFALKLPTRIRMKTEPFGTIISIAGIVITFAALGMNGN